MTTTATFKVYDHNPQARCGNDPYQVVERMLKSRQAFAGNSMSGYWTPEGQYIVVSYSTVIATVTDGKVEIAENRWGQTTGRHINLCKRCLS